jgi:hypothetical protein
MPIRDRISRRACGRQAKTQSRIEKKYGNGIEAEFSRVGISKKLCGFA